MLKSKKGFIIKILNNILIVVLLSTSFLTVALAKSNNQKVIGTWLVNNGYKYKQTYFYKGKSLFSKTSFSDGSGSTEKVKYIKMKNGTIKIPNIDPYGVYCLITPDKKLQFWGSSGNFLTAKIFKEKKEVVPNIYVGQKVPYDKWDIYGSPKTLNGTNNKFWIVFLPKINMTFKAKKITDIIVSVEKGRVPNL